VLEQGTTVRGILVSAEEPLFANPEQVVSLGAGILITDFAALDDYTASVDVVVSPRAPLEGRAVISQLAGLSRMGAFDIIGPGNPVNNEAPIVKIGVPFPQTFANQPFDVTLAFDDADGDYIEIMLAIKDLNTDHIIYRSKRAVYDTSLSDPLSEQVILTVPGFPAGPYKVIVESDDGIAYFVLAEKVFRVGPGAQSPNDGPRAPNR
jgi:hypothetical protein